jgi:hypothetical protein
MIKEPPVSRRERDIYAALNGAVKENSEIRRDKEIAARGGEKSYQGRAIVFGLFSHKRNHVILACFGSREIWIFVRSTLRKLSRELARTLSLSLSLSLFTFFRAGTRKAQKGDAPRKRVHAKSPEQSESSRGDPKRKA